MLPLENEFVSKVMFSLQNQHVNLHLQLPTHCKISATLRVNVSIIYN